MIKKFLLGVAFSCLLTVSSSSVVFSTFDNRYPSVITEDTRVFCPEEGSYPHPAGCTWFYRCVDKWNLGFFHVYFFKCEPGTIFSDDLDQCVYGDPSQCQGNLIGTGSNQSTGSPGLTPSQTAAPAGPDATPSTTSQSTTESPQTPRPTESPTVPTTVTAEVVDTTITDSSPSGPPQPPSLTTSQTITSETSSTTEISPPSPPPNPSPTEPSPTGSGATSLIACSNCVSRMVCKIGRAPYEIKVCDSCKFPSNTEHLTPAEECPYHPDPHLTDEGRCISGQELCPEPVVKTQSDQPQGDEPLYTIKCSATQIRPDDSKIRGLFCKNYLFCSPFGSYKGSQNLCTNFFQCYKTTEGHWTAELRHCTGDNLYSFDLDQCLPKPRELDLCTRR